MEEHSLETVKEMMKSKNETARYIASKLLSGPKFKDSKEASLLFNKMPLFDKVKTYGDVCKFLPIKELTIEDFDFLPEEQRLKSLNFHKLQNIAKLFNGTWKINWKDSKQEKWYPWFDTNSSGLVFGGSGCDRGYSYGTVAYFPDRETSDYIGKTFLDLYKGILE